MQDSVDLDRMPGSGVSGNLRVIKDHHFAIKHTLWQKGTSQYAKSGSALSCINA